MLIQLYSFSNGAFQVFSRTLRRVLLIIKSGHVSLWLILLERQHFHQFDKIFWSSDKMYRDEEYILQGFWGWEEPIAQDHLAGCGSLLISSTGGGREVAAFRRLGLAVDGFECNRELLEFSNDLLAKIGSQGNLRSAPRDGCPEISRQYGGLVVGWGSYGLIHGSERRIAFLARLRGYVGEGAPILLSFFARSSKARYFKAIAATANRARRILRKNPVEVGDVLDPYYVHYFTEEEIRTEMLAAGFEMQLYSTDGYGHAVGTAI